MYWLVRVWVPRALNVTQRLSYKTELPFSAGTNYCGIEAGASAEIGAETGAVTGA